MTKYLIIYCTSHGTTEKVANKLADLLEDEVTLINLKKHKKSIKLETYDSVIIGASIHVGNIQGKITQFLKDHHDDLTKKTLGLFLCCMNEGELAEEQFNNNYPEKLRDISLANGIFGGEFLISKMNFLEKKVIKKISGTIEDTSNLDENRIKQFAEAFNQLVSVN